MSTPFATAARHPLVGYRCDRPRLPQLGFSALCSVLLHLALLLYLLTRLPLHGVPQAAAQRALQVQFTTESVAPAVPPVSRVEPLPLISTAASRPLPRVPLLQARPYIPALRPPTAAPSKPQADTRPAQQTQSARQRAAAGAPHVDAQRQARSRQQARGDDGEASSVSLLSSVRANWLRPAHARLIFRCRFVIDYGAGGVIVNVTQQQDCGDAELDDSVMRAIWKSQPLPIPAPADGRVVLEFTP